MIQNTYTDPLGQNFSVPTDANGNESALGFFLQGAGVPVPISEYTERLIWPSGVIRGANGRVTSPVASGLGQFNKAILLLDIHTMTRDDANETLNVALETSYDQGQNWHSFAGFDTVNTTGIQSQVLVVAPSGGSNRPIYKNINNTIATLQYPINQLGVDVFGDQMRVSAIFTDAVGADSSGIFSVYGSFKKA